MQRRPNSITFLDPIYVLRGASKRGRDVLREVRPNDYCIGSNNEEDAIGKSSSENTKDRWIRRR
jgi:hypothetical protein